MLARFSGVESKRTAHLSLEKGKENFSVVVTHSIKLACENWKFFVVAVV